MNFDYTYLAFRDFLIFEPMIIVTNLIFLIFCVYYYRQLQRFSNSYARHMSWFILLLGISSIFGAAAHAIHYQMGVTLFKLIFFGMGALSLFSMYFCFRGALTYYRMNGTPQKKYIYGVMVYLFLAILLCALTGSFLLIEINGGIALIYAFIVHYKSYRKNHEKGSRLFMTGIGVSVFSMIVHLAKVSIHEWFNQKDLAHVIMIAALSIIGRGAVLNSGFLMDRKNSH